jgi:predicted Zn finger-like uncharacterized protein
MVITCPSCKRRFNLPSNMVRGRVVKLKCSRCKSLFNQDLAELVGVAHAKLSEEEERLIARLPVQAAPAAKPAPPPSPGAPRMAAPRAPTAGAATSSVTKPMPPVAPRPAPKPAAAPTASPAPAPAVAPAPAPRPAPPPRPAPKPVEPVIQGYESYAEAPELDDEHQEALERAAEAAAVQVALREQQEAEERKAADAQAAEDAVQAALDEAAQEAEAQGQIPIDEPPSAEVAFAASVDSELPPDLRAGLEAAAQEPAAPAPAAFRTTDPRNQGAAGLFLGGQTPSGRFVLPGGGEVDDFLLLSDEEAPGAMHYVGIGVTILLVLLLATSVFVLARNGWKLNTSRLWQQVQHAFWLAPPVVEQASCVTASIRIPTLVPGADGTVVVTRGTINNSCGYSITGVSVRCKLEGPGGPWTDTAQPFVEAGASDLSEEDLSGKSSVGMQQEISDRENSAGVVLPGGTPHEFWCIFPGAARPDSRSTQFRPSFEVSAP